MSKGTGQLLAGLITDAGEDAAVSVQVQVAGGMYAGAVKFAPNGDTGAEFVFELLTAMQSQKGAMAPIKIYFSEVDLQSVFVQATDEVSPIHQPNNGRGVIIPGVS